MPSMLLVKRTGWISIKSGTGGQPFLERRTTKAFRIIWALIFVHIVMQGGQNLWIQQEASKQYEEQVVAADFLPGRFTVVGKSGDDVEIYDRSLLLEGLAPPNLEKIVLKSENDPRIMEQILEDPEAAAIAWFSPFYVVQVEEEGNQRKAILFDPRFYRDGKSFLRKEVVLQND